MRVLLLSILLCAASCSKYDELVRKSPITTRQVIDNLGVEGRDQELTKSKCGNPESYVVFGKRYYVLDSSVGYKERGLASWYGKKFHGRRTSSCESYDMYDISAAHKTLPLPTYVKVTNLKNKRSLIIRVNDRGPFYGDRIIDLSYAAAKKLDMITEGVAMVEVEAVANQRIYDNTSVQYNDDQKIYLQIGVFKQLANAQKLKEQIEQQYKMVIHKKQNAGDTLYHVRIGPLADMQQADLIVSNLVKNGIYEHYIVTQ